MDNTQGVIMAMGGALVVVLLYGIYKLIMRWFSASTTLQAGTAAAKKQQAVKTIFVIIVSIVIFAAVYFAYDYFMHREI